MKAISVIFENQEILLINKPAGVSVQGGVGISHPLDDELSKQLGYRIHLVHRLDKETAGILLVAKNPESASKWTKLISTKQVKKEYMAICVGQPKVRGKKMNDGVLEGTVEAHGRVQNASTFFHVEKVTVAKIQKQDEEGNVSVKEVPLSLVSLTLGSGRMHQIRIQMAKEAQCPLCGDDQHGDFKANKLLRKVGIKKLCLASVKLTVPIDGKERVFQIPLPEHMQSAVDSLFN